MTSESVTFPSRDGLQLTGTLERSDTTSEVAAVLVHGITSEQHESGFYTEIAEQLASVGVPSIRFNWRCHGGNPLPLEQLSLTGIVNDIHSAVTHLQRSDAVQDLRGIVVVGASFGGGTALYWAAHQTTVPVKGCVLLAPVIDYAADLFRGGELSDDMFLSTELSAELAHIGTVPTSSLPVGRAVINELPYFDCESAFRNATFPITIFHGGSDSDVPLSSSEKYVPTNNSAHLVVVPEVDHGFVVPGTEFTDPVNDRAHKHVALQVSSVISSTLL